MLDKLHYGIRRFIVVVMSISIIHIVRTCYVPDLNSIINEETSPPPFPKLNYDTALFGEMSPYIIMKTVFESDEPELKAAVVAGTKRVGRGGEEAGRIRYEPHADLDDYGDLFRCVVRYSGELTGQRGGSSPVRSNIRIYFYDHGAVFAETVCLAETLVCSGWVDMMAAFEDRLRSQLSDGHIDIQALAGDCPIVDSISPLTKTEIDLVHCRDEADLSLQARVVGKDEAFILLAAIFEDTELLQIIESAESEQN